jgi:soluble lytic murein transglycosylase-like protein
MTRIPARCAQAGWALVLELHRAFQSPERKPGAWRCHVRAAAFAMLCSAHCTSGAAAPLLSAASSPVSAKTNDGYAGWVAEASRRFNIPIAWITAVMHVESGGNARSVSPKGAIGLMQIMPRTWADLQARYHLGSDPFDPHDNIIGGVAYLRELEDRFGSSDFLAAYHAGPGQLVDILAGLRPLGSETRAYLTRLSRLLPDLPIGRTLIAEDSAVAWQRSALFSTLHQTVRVQADRSTTGGVGSAAAPSSFALTPHPDGLFVAIPASETR